MNTRMIVVIFFLIYGFLYVFIDYLISIFYFISLNVKGYIKILKLLISNENFPK